MNMRLMQSDKQTAQQNAEKTINEIIKQLTALSFFQDSHKDEKNDNLKSLQVFNKLIRLHDPRQLDTLLKMVFQFNQRTKCLIEKEMILFNKIMNDPTRFDLIADILNMCYKNSKLELVPHADLKASSSPQRLAWLKEENDSKNTKFFSLLNMLMNNLVINNKTNQNLKDAIELLDCFSYEYDSLGYAGSGNEDPIFNIRYLALVIQNIHHIDSFLIVLRALRILPIEEYANKKYFVIQLSDQLEFLLDGSCSESNAISIANNLQNYSIFESHRLSEMIFTYAKELDNPLFLKVITQLDSINLIDLLIKDLMSLFMQMTYKERVLTDFLSSFEEKELKDPLTILMLESHVSIVQQAGTERIFEKIKQWWKPVAEKIKQGQAEQAWSNIAVLTSFCRVNRPSPLHTSIVTLLRDKTPGSIYCYLSGSSKAEVKSVEDSVNADDLAAVSSSAEEKTVYFERDSNQQKTEAPLREAEIAQQKAEVAQFSSPSSAVQGYSQKLFVANVQKADVQKNEAATKLTQKDTVDLASKEESSPAQKISDAYRLLLNKLQEEDQKLDPKLKQILSDTFSPLEKIIKNFKELKEQALLIKEKCNKALTNVNRAISMKTLTKEADLGLNSLSLLEEYQRAIKVILENVELFVKELQLVQPNKHFPKAWSA